MLSIGWSVLNQLFLIIRRNEYKRSLCMFRCYLYVHLNQIYAKKAKDKRL